MIELERKNRTLIFHRKHKGIVENSKEFLYTTRINKCIQQCYNQYIRIISISKLAIYNYIMKFSFLKKHSQQQ